MYLLGLFCDLEDSLIRPIVSIFKFLNGVVMRVERYKSLCTLQRGETHWLVWVFDLVEWGFKHSHFIMFVCDGVNPIVEVIEPLKVNKEHCLSYC